ncbi:MAG TPA: VOC family protein [Thermoanaerobaculia bacterium]|nr:VOC family protein [Thermoanaerobaculia bacterium]
MKIVAFVPTTDFDKARAFYEGVVGLRFAGADGHALRFDVDGTMLRVTKVPAFTPFPWTILGWEVPDIAAAVVALRERGVKFESYGFPGQDADGIWTAPSGDKVAWFKDPDGNTLSISQHVG